jgi:regulator of RNase E activity RraA
MSLRAQTLGAAGVIIDGRVRDLQEHRDLEFPVSQDFIILTPSKVLFTTLSKILSRREESQNLF